MPHPPSALPVTRRWVVLASLALACIISAAWLAAPARASVPFGFVGMNADGPILQPNVNFSRQLGTMVSSGVDSLRMTFNWAVSQPYPNYQALRRAHDDPHRYVNVAGVPTNFGEEDIIVYLAAQHGLQVLPVVIYAPKWDAAKRNKQKYAHARPKKFAPYASFVKGLVQRYGPNGTFWQAHPNLPYMPVKMWQIWNEPSIPGFWPKRPWEKSFAKLMIAAHAAIKSVDPSAKVVLAGLPNYSWIYLKGFYKIPGARNSFDIVDLHPYTATPKGVIKILGNVRSVMDKNGDGGKPIIATEVGWPSSLHKAAGFLGTTEKGQAKDVAEVLPLLAKNRSRLHLIGFDYYTWIGYEHPGADFFAFSGLYRVNSKGKVSAKPAAAAFKKGALSLEGCSSKGPLAANCN